MKILYVVEHYYPYIGGVEKLFTSLAEAMARQGHQVTVITTLHQSSLSKKELINGVLVRRIPVKNRYIFTFFGWIWILKHAFGKEFIHTTSYNAALPAFFTGLFTGKKVIITFHEVWNKQWFQVPFLSKFERWSFYFYEQFILHLPFHKFIGVSDFTYQTLQNTIGRKRVVKILNGLDYSNLPIVKPKDSKKEFSYLFFGRLGVSKGIDIIIKGAKRFNAHNNSTFHFVLPKYPKPMRKKVLELLKTQNPQHTILYHELPFNELISLMDMVDCVVVPSLSEGFGFSAAECCARGIPVISSELGALPEVTFGKVIPIHPYDEIGLANALEKAKNGDWNFKPEKKYPLSETVENYLSLYNEIT